MNVLFVCRANAARSQEAEEFYNFLTGTTNASSAGVDLAHSVKGDDPSLPEVVIEVMSELGHDVSKRKRKVLTEQMVLDADKVISMIEDYPLPYYLATSTKLERWNGIPDPVGKPIETHREVRDLVRQEVVRLLQTQ